MRVSSRGDSQYMLRFPDNLRDKMKVLAQSNGRSMNSEVLIAIEKHLASSGVELPAQPKPYNARLDTFVAAALSGLIAANGKMPLDEFLVRDAVTIGQRTIEIMEADQ